MNILENEKVRLEKVVKSLEEKIKLLELKISEITLANQQVKVLQIYTTILLNSRIHNEK